MLPWYHSYWHIRYALLLALFRGGLTSSLPGYCRSVATRESLKASAPPDSHQPAFLCRAANRFLFCPFIVFSVFNFNEDLTKARYLVNLFCSCWRWFYLVLANYFRRYANTEAICYNKNMDELKDSRHRKFSMVDYGRKDPHPPSFWRRATCAVPSAITPPCCFPTATTPRNPPFSRFWDTLPKKRDT